MRRSMAVAATALEGTWPTGMAAQPASRASPDVTRPFEVRWSLKGTGVFTRPSQEGLWRWRIEPTVPVGARATIEFAYEHRLAVFDEGGRPRQIEAPRFRRDGLKAGNRIAGPAVIDQMDATTVIPPGFAAKVDGCGNLVIAGVEGRAA